MFAAAILLTGGAAGVAFAGSPSETAEQSSETADGEAVIDSFRERISTLETVQFTRNSSLTFDNRTSTTTVRVDADLDAFEKRTETVDSSYGGDSVTTVVNESTAVTYDAEENHVWEYDVRARTLLPRIEPLANESLLSYEYGGTATVDGRETYVLNATPTQQYRSDIETSTTVYVDAETYFPVRIDSETHTEEYTHSSTVRFENVTLNEEIPDSTFELDVPANATDPTANLGPEITDYESHDELVADANASVPAAEIGEGFSFEEGTIVDGESYYAVTLRYDDGDRTISVNTRAEPIGDPDYDELDAYEAVDVGDRTGYLTSHGEFTLLHWEADQPHTLYGEIDNGTAISVAESIVDG